MQNKGTTVLRDKRDKLRKTTDFIIANSFYLVILFR